MKEYTYKCLDCGEEYTTTVYRVPLRRKCVSCALKRIGESVMQLRDHKGPYYDRWLASMRANADRASEGIKRFLDEQGAD